jgi:Ca2+-binding EF-hand superfamily protein
MNNNYSTSKKKNIKIYIYKNESSCYSSNSDHDNNIKDIKISCSKIKLEEEDIEKIQEAFKLFDFDGKGKSDPQFVHEIMDKMNYEEKNPGVYKIIVELDNPENLKNGGVNYE